MSRDREKVDTDEIAVLGAEQPARPAAASRDTDEKYGEEEITPAIDEKDIKEAIQHKEQSDITPEMRRKIVEYYGRKAEEDDIAPASDVTIILEKILEMDEEEALDICANAITYHGSDPNFPSITMAKLKYLLQGYKGADMDPADWSFELRTEACMLHWHSPYPEVRSVTDPFDDFTIPVETPRAYFLGMMFMSGATLINTFFSPRQPSISIGANVLQLLLAPCGIFLAKVLPKWSCTMPARVPFFGGCVYALNPGPWSYKEQMLATIMFSIANSAGGTYYVYLVQMLPQYLDQQWVSFPYEVLLALSVQYFGLGFAGILRRFVVYPVEAIWPRVLPTLALNRALLIPETYEKINGWTVSRYRFFMYCFGGMFLYFWIPNTFFTGLRLMNWMTWIAPNNFNLGMITGSYGGMGFNPISTLDWNTSGSGALLTPFWSTAQAYLARVLSGLIIIAMFYGNMSWAAYTPINSNESFRGDGTKYVVSEIMGDDGYVDIAAYAEYGPPYFTGANVFGQGAWFAWYPMSLFYICIKNWVLLKKAGWAMMKSIKTRGSIYEGHNDPHTRMIKRYGEVPEYWFLSILVLSFVSGVIALEVWPTHTPWWSLLLILSINGVFLVPVAIMVATSNVALHTGVLFQLLAGVIYAGNPQAQIIMQAFATNFQSQADNYIADQKLAHYAKLPPRAVFRSQIIAVFINCFLFIAMLNWMVGNFNRGTLCTWDNEQRFVCAVAVAYYTSAVQYGAFGVRNMFKLYPIFPWCFLIGAVLGIAIACMQKYGHLVRDFTSRRWSEKRQAVIEKYFYGPMSSLYFFDPAVFWSGALNWTAGNNLTYATQGLYLSFIFMYYIKRRYQNWWEKYNYLIEAGFDVGVAISAIIQTLIFAFSNGGEGIRLNWWGNNVATQGYDYQAYVQNATLYPIPEQGYFGLAKEDWPFDWGGREKSYFDSLAANSTA